MSTNYQWKRLISLLLVLVMVIGMVPMHGHAAESGVVDAAIIFTDLHTSSSDYKESTIKNIFGALKNTGLPFSSVTSGGDAFSVNEDNSSSNGPYTGKTSTLTGYIQNVLGDVPVNYVWSDHDRYAVQEDDAALLDKTSRLVYGAGDDGVYGTGDDGNYYVYALSMGDLCSYDRYSAGFNYTQTSSTSRAAKGFTATVEQAIANFEADAAKLNKDRPLFIVSHQPLYDNRNDNAFAEDWFDAINTVAEDMDVAFFYGHNHKYDTGNDYYYAKGSTMPVATADKWGWDYDVGEGYLPSMDLSSENKTLNFTHMCAGYMAPSSTGSTSSTTREGVAMGITIYEDAISYTTYSASGVYTGNYALNETVKRDHAAVAEPAPSEPEVTEPEATEPVVSAPVEDSNGTGVTVAASGVTKVEVSVAENPSYDTAVYTAYASFDIQVAGHVNGVEATVTLPAPAGFDPMRPVQVLYEGDVIATTSIVDGKITFTTDHFSVYDVAQTAEGDLEWIEIPVSSGEAYYELATSIESGETYLIGNNSSGSSIRLLTSTGGKSDYPTYSDGKITDGVTAECEWLFNASGSGYTIQDADKQYLYPNASYKSGWFGSGSWSYSLVHNGTGATPVSVSVSSSGAATLSRRVTSGSNSTTAYLRYSSSAFGASGSSGNLYLFKKVALPAESVYAALEGQTSFQFGVDEYSEDAIRNAITVYTATDANGTGKAAVTNYELVGTVDGSTAETYTLSVRYGGKEVGTITVEVQDITVEKLELITASGSVARDSKATTATGGKVLVTYSDGSQEEKDVTLGMLDNNGSVSGTFSNLTVTYGGKTVSGFTLTVLNKEGNNYPEYPNEGAVKVSKTATGVDFQSTGVAQVEVSASGVPMKRGVDVIVMLDMSSSMTRCIAHDTKSCSTCKADDSTTNALKTRQEEMEAAILQFQTILKSSPNASDIRVAIADFNGFYGSTTPYYRDSSDQTADDNALTDNANAKVYTGDGSLTVGAFTTADKLNVASYTFTPSTGTNYDYAFDAIYQLGHAVKTENEKNGEERDLYVLFMSDGAPNQYNYYGSIGGSTPTEGSDNWNYWLTGTPDDFSGGLEALMDCNTHLYYYDEATGNQHRMANAIKGSPSEYYEIIRKNQNNRTDAVTDALIPLESTDANYGKDNMYKLPGLGANLYAIAFDIAADGAIKADSVNHVLQSIPSSSDMYFEASESGKLVEAFNKIASDILYAAYNARYVDQMGADYSLQMGPIKDLNGNVVAGVENKIEIISYDIYTKAEADASATDNITEDMIGDRKGTYTVLETVTFSTDGKEAYSDKKEGNILVDGVINAQTFWYNTTATAVAVDGVAIPTGVNADGTTTGTTNMLPSETFYWKMGTVKTSELAMRYYVYLEGSMEGTREAGSYPTNEYATLYYDNYLGNPAYKDTVSPVMAWKEANVSYAFYLVDENGNIVVNQTTGQTGSFANKIAVTNPVVYETVLLNSDEEVSSIDIASLGVLPEGYTLYDYDGANGATYTVTINSNSTGAWNITSVKDPATTYVMQYNPEDASAYSNEKTVNESGLDYTHTVVWFAVVWEVQALPDTVVVDYGLPVDISVLANDMFGDNGKLAGVGAYSESLNLDGFDTALASGFGTDYNGTYGSARANAATGKVRYTVKDMQMNGYEKFAYAVNYTGNENAGYYYDTVTVIPATTIYYEDDFLTYTASNTEWTTEGDLVSGVQAEDRPGQFSLTDANNIYGYDAANLNMSTHSMGQARKVHVDADSYATASFTFWGTGFDVVSMTSNTTGTLTVQVQEVGGEVVRRSAVGTYYGYKYENGEWIPTPGEDNALYQVPVIQIADLPYKQYTVTIKATYANALDKTTEDGYWLYLDAVRIYDPANDGASDGTTDTTIEDAYKADGEGWPSYIELRNKLIAAEDIFGYEDTNTKITGVVFIDGKDEVGNDQVEDYKNYGPNNEVYLAPGQKVAFILEYPTNINRVHIGIKSADGKTGTYTINNIARNGDSEAGINAGDSYNVKTGTISTATDMYYDLTGYIKKTNNATSSDIIVISNTGDPEQETSGIISITDIKSTYTSDPASGAVTVSEEELAPVSETLVYMTPAAATLTLRTLNAPVEDDVPEETVPEETVPETTVPEETVPEETVPETTVPEETESEETVPETTVPEETVPEETEPEQSVEEVITTVVKEVVKVVKKLLGWLFR